MPPPNLRPAPTRTGPSNIAQGKSGQNNLLEKPRVDRKPAQTPIENNKTSSNTRRRLEELGESEESFNRQEGFFYDLETRRASEVEDREIQSLQSLLIKRKPKKKRYLMAYTLALVGDITDIVGSLSVIGATVQWIIDLYVDVLLTALGFKFNKEAKKVSKDRQAISQNSLSSSQRMSLNSSQATNIENTRRTKISTANQGSVQNKPVKQSPASIPGGHSTPKVRAPRGTGKAAGVIQTKNPLINLLIAQLLDLIPFVDILPLRLISVNSAKKNEQRAYQSLKTEIQDYINQITEERLQRKELQALINYENTLIAQDQDLAA